jgi:hypothetical protein
MRQTLFGELVIGTHIVAQRFHAGGLLSPSTFCPASPSWIA